MKNLMLAFMAIAIALPTLAQKSFEGTIVFSLDYKDLPAEMAAMSAMLPDEMTTKVTSTKTRIEQSMGMGMSQVTIVDIKKGSGVLLMDMMGQKKAIEMSEEEFKKMDKKKSADKKPEFKYVDGQGKTIAGYKCEKAIVVIEGVGEMEVFYTKDLPAGASKQFEGLNGFPLEYTIKQGPMTILVSATSVKQEKLDKKLFEVPDGYEKLTFEEFQKQMGGMMGG